MIAATAVRLAAPLCGNLLILVGYSNRRTTRLTPAVVLASCAAASASLRLTMPIR